jgi:hypothetical protein
VGIKFWFKWFKQLTIDSWVLLFVWALIIGSMLSFAYGVYQLLALLIDKL